MLRKFLVRNAWIAAVLLLALAMVGSQLLIKPLIGVADNGDFGRLMCTGLFGFQQEASPHQSFDYFYHSYWLDPQYRQISYWSSQIALLDVARWISMRIWSHRNNTVYFFDIRILALVTIGLLLSSFGLGLAAVNRRSIPEKILASVFVLFCLCDIGYVQYFNSFFSEPSSFVWLVMLISGCLFFVLTQPFGMLRVAMMGLILCSMIFFVTAKAQNVPLAIPFAILLYRFQYVSIPDRYLWLRRAVLPLLVMLVASVYFVSGRDTEIKRTNLYHHFFGELVPGSAEPSQVLSEFGLPASYANLSRTNWFTPGIPKNDPAFLQQFYSRVGLASVIGFYLRHPDRLYRLSLQKSRYAFEMRTYLGNFEPDSGQPPRAQSQRFATWSRWKHWLADKTDGPQGSSLFFVVLFIQSALVLLKRFRWDRDHADRLLTELHGCLVVSAGLVFLAIVVGEGHTDEISRYMLVVNVLMDFCWALTLGYGLSILRWRFSGAESAGLPVAS